MGIDEYKNVSKLHTAVNDASELFDAKGTLRLRLEPRPENYGMLAFVPDGSAFLSKCTSVNGSQEWLLPERIFSEYQGLLD